MTAPSIHCSVCGTTFEMHFRYQAEERIETEPNGATTTRTIYYCSQRCLEASHHQSSDGQASCDACAQAFTVEYAAQVVFTGGRRHYACTSACRAKVLEGVRTIRLGQLADPGFPVQEVADPDDLPIMTGQRLSRPTATPSAPRVSPRVPATVVPVHAAAAKATTPARGPRVLAVFNHKGGTAKTTTSVHVAAGLAARGKRVLLVDTDGQGNVATSLGLEFQRSLYHVIVMGLDFREVAVPARENLDVVPSNETLAAAELYLAGQQRRDRLLASRFASARALYDYVIVDCSPSLSLMNQNALVMADAVLCPVACDYLSLVGVQKVVRTIKQVNRLLAHPLNFWGVLPTFFDTRARICHEALDTLRGHFREVCLPPIRFASRVKEAPSQGKTLFEYAPGSSSAQDYMNVVDRLLADEQKSEREATGILEGVA